MDRRNVVTVGVRRTGWAALDRDPQQDTVEFICPHCGARDKKNARRERALYRFTDGFLQDLQGEVTQRSEEHTSELQSRLHLVCRLLLEKKKKNNASLNVTARRIGPKLPPSPRTATDQPIPVPPSLPHRSDRHESHGLLIPHMPLVAAR